MTCFNIITIYCLGIITGILLAVMVGGYYLFIEEVSDDGSD